MAHPISRIDDLSSDYECSLCYHAHSLPTKKTKTKAHLILKRERNAEDGFRFPSWHYHVDMSISYAMTYKKKCKNFRNRADSKSRSMLLIF